MNPAMLQNFLYQNIPAAAALQLAVLESTPERVALLAPFAPNQNHHHTIFGGSIALAATLCGWSLVHVRHPECKGKIVIQEGHTRYLKPAEGDLTAICETADEAAWAKCAEMLARRGKGKIDLLCSLYSEGVLAAEFSGRYVVLK
ncbi:MAG: YiiD C-terminal domain-containing protein [Neisseria sp.]|nr:YiiD C-terminal domain-containing protein [Neisseria sp.]